MSRDDAVVLLSRVELYFGRPFPPVAAQDYVNDFAKYDHDVLKLALDQIMRSKPPTAYPPTRVDIKAAVQDVMNERWQKTKRESPTYRNLLPKKEAPDRQVASEFGGLICQILDHAITQEEFKERHEELKARHGL